MSKLVLLHVVWLFEFEFEWGPGHSHFLLLPTGTGTRNGNCVTTHHMTFDKVCTYVYMLLGSSSIIIQMMRLFDRTEGRLFINGRGLHVRYDEE